MERPTAMKRNEAVFSRRIFFRGGAALTALGLAALALEAPEPVQTANANPVAEFVRKCVTRFTLKTHARAERPNQNIEGIRVEVFNTTNPSQRIILTADQQQDYRPAKGYLSNTYQEGTLDRSAVLYGDVTGKGQCENVPICLGGEQSVDKTTLGLVEIDKNGKPVTGKVSMISADCPPFQECEKWAAWAVEGEPIPTVTPTLAPPTILQTPTVGRVPVQRS